MRHLGSASDFDRFGPWALIAGASEGIGAAFAWELAPARFSLILVARSGDRLDALAAALTAGHGAAVRNVACDLADPDAAERVADVTRDLTVGLLVKTPRPRRLDGFSTRRSRTISAR